MESLTKFVLNWPKVCSYLLQITKESSKNNEVDQTAFHSLCISFLTLTLIGQGQTRYKVVLGMKYGLNQEMQFIFKIFDSTPNLNASNYGMRTFPKYSI